MVIITRTSNTAAITNATSTTNATTYRGAKASLSLDYCYYCHSDTAYLTVNGDRISKMQSVQSRQIAYCKQPTEINYQRNPTTQFPVEITCLRPNILISHAEPEVRRAHKSREQSN